MVGIERCFDVLAQDTVGLCVPEVSLPRLLQLPQDERVVIGDLGWDIDRLQKDKLKEPMDAGLYNFLFRVFNMLEGEVDGIYKVIQQGGGAVAAISRVFNVVA